MEPDLVQHNKCIGQKENNPASIPRYIESDDNRGHCLHGPNLRDSPHGENLHVEPALQSAGVNYCETPSIRKR